ncbi:hypothetical protein BG004_005409 [Podila humilis]|nr:hypothetical protein BG004_005409 [Podila humilis]
MSSSSPPTRETLVLFTFPYPPLEHDHHHYFPSSVQVTGNFDEWQRTCYLHKNDALNRFEVHVEIDLERLPLVKVSVLKKNTKQNQGGLDEEEEEKDEQVEEGQRKVVYKFVLDGQNWIADPEQDQERDDEGNLNNIRFLEDVAMAEKEARYEVTRLQEQKQQMKATDADGAVAIDDAKSTQDGSTVTTTMAVSDNHKRHNVLNVDGHDGDGDNNVVLLEGEPVTPKNKTSGGSSSLTSSIHKNSNNDKDDDNDSKIDAKPAMDESTVPAASLDSGNTESSTSSSPPRSSRFIRPATVHISTVPASSGTSLETASPTNTTPGATINSSSCATTISSSQSQHSLLLSNGGGSSGGGADGRNMNMNMNMNKMIMPSTPTTAISTSAPSFPSSDSLSNTLQNEASGNFPVKQRKLGFWKKLKKAFS